MRPNNRRDRPSGRDSRRPAGRSRDRQGPRESSGRFGGDRFGRRDAPRSSSRNFSGSRSYSGPRDRRDLPGFKVKCDKCGQDCEVPFRPTGDKPVLCSYCFRKDGGKSSSSPNLEEINKKLDKILDVLGVE